MSNEEGDEIDGEEVGTARLACERRTEEQTDAEEKRKSMKQHTYRPETGAHTACWAEDAPVTTSLKEKKEDQSRRPTIAMDHYVMKMKFWILSFEFKVFG